MYRYTQIPMYSISHSRYLAPEFQFAHTALLLLPLLLLASIYPQNYASETKVYRYYAAMTSAVKSTVLVAVAAFVRENSRELVLC